MLEQASPMTEEDRACGSPPASQGQLEPFDGPHAGGGSSRERIPSWKAQNRFWYPLPRSGSNPGGPCINCGRFGGRPVERPRGDDDIDDEQLDPQTGVRVHAPAGELGQSG